MFYQAFAARKELAEERERSEKTEKELNGKDRENRRLLDSNKDLCGSLRDERERSKEKETEISRLKTKRRRGVVVMIVMAFFLALSVLVSIVLVNQGRGYKSFVSELREMSDSTPDLVSDSIRYKYEDIFGERL